jgi:8-oxo-dGTP pyrophosphatase MutT (NUDIX family)
MSETMVYKTAGGVVINKNGEILALARQVMRNGKIKDELRLPKGHIDPGETDAETAVREVGEESGYWLVEIIADLGEAHSSFSVDGVHYERDEHYFLMRLTEERRDAPQPVSEDEALFSPRWLAAEEVPGQLTYSTEQAIAQRACDYLMKQKQNN